MAVERDQLATSDTTKVNNIDCIELDSNQKA